MAELTRRSHLKMLAGATAMLGFGKSALAALAQETPPPAVPPMKGLTEAEMAVLRASSGIPGLGVAYSANGARPKLIANGLRSIDANVPGPSMISGTSAPTPNR